MRGLVLVLVLANLLAYAWLQGWLASFTGSERQPERLTRQIDPERVRILEIVPRTGAAADKAVAADGPVARVSAVRTHAVSPAPLISDAYKHDMPAVAPAAGSPAPGPAPSGNARPAGDADGATAARSDGRGGDDDAPRSPPLASGTDAPAQRACYELGGLDPERADRIRPRLEEAGASTIAETVVENRSGYIVYLPTFESQTLAQERIEQLHAQGVSDTYLIIEGTYRLAISLGVYNRLESARVQIDQLRQRGIDDALVGFVNPAASRLSLRVEGNADAMDEASLRAIAAAHDARLGPCLRSPAI